MRRQQYSVFEQHFDSDLVDRYSRSLIAYRMHNSVFRSRTPLRLPYPISYRPQNADAAASYHHSIDLRALFKYLQPYRRAAQEAAPISTF